MSEPRRQDAALDRRVAKPEESAGWLPVRESWVDVPDAPPASAVRERSDPPPLPRSVRELPEERAPEEAAFVDMMLERLAAGDYAGSLMAAEALLRAHPNDADALDCAEMSRAELRKLYVARLGRRDRVPHITMPREQIAGHNLDALSGFVLWRVDGSTALDEIVFAAGIPPHDVLRALSELYLQGLIAFDR